LLNTSLNIGSEPNMSTDGVINDFFNSSLDHLFLKYYLIEK